MKSDDEVFELLFSLELDIKQVGRDFAQVGVSIVFNDSEPFLPQSFLYLDVFVYASR